MTNTITSADLNVRITPEAADLHRTCLKMIQAARAWTQDTRTFTASISDEGAWRREYEARRTAVDEMEISYLRNLAHVLFMSQGWDGPLTLTSDGPRDFFWRHTPAVAGRTGMVGGLNFHFNHAFPRDEQTPVGVWSVNT